MPTAVITLLNYTKEIAISGRCFASVASIEFRPFCERVADVALHITPANVH